MAQGINLIAAAVGQNRVVPSVAMVQPSGAGQYFQAGPQVEVISIPENDLSAHLFRQFALMDSLDAAYRPYRHKNRRFYHAVGRLQAAGPRIGFRIGMF